MKKYLIILLCLLYRFANAQVPYPAAPPVAGPVNNIEYFTDSNPGFNNGTALTGFTSSANINNFNGTVNITALTPGFHRIYFRSKDADGKWSVTNNSYFDNYTVPLYNAAPAAPSNIIQLEYFIDNNDLGFGNCTPLSITPNTNIANLNANINVTGVPPGVHRLFIRSKDAGGKWALTNFSVFDNSTATPYPNAPAPVTNIIQAEYFFDNNDLGFGNCTPLLISPGTNIINLNANVNIGGLIPGVHRLFVRSKDANGKWSLVNFSVFDNSSIPPYPNAPATPPPISNMEYYVDTDPGFGNGTTISVPGNTGDISGYSFNVNLSGSLSAGTHYLYIRSKQNPWSLTTIVPFTASGALPLTWSFVKAQIINNQTLISWATEQEINTNKFEIEHSIDGINFLKIGEVAAAGNSSYIKNYNFLHQKPVSGFNFYRIKQIDDNGNFKYSVIVKVLNRSNIKQTIIAPNPVTDILNVLEPAAAFINSVEVYDSKGALIIRKIINAEAAVYSLPVAVLTSGNYVFKINYKNESKTFLFVK
jgi:hypothetical protein